MQRCRILTNNVVCGDMQWLVKSVKCRVVNLLVDSAYTDCYKICC